MINVHVGQDHPLDVGGADSDRPQLSPSLLIWLDVRVRTKSGNTDASVEAA